jgi:hypothetical protein
MRGWFSGLLKENTDASMSPLPLSNEISSQATIFMRRETFLPSFGNRASLACFLSSIRVIFKSIFACIDNRHRRKQVAKVIAENTLFYGDNQNIPQQYVIDECVDLVYLGPPF